MVKSKSKKQAPSSGLFGNNLRTILTNILDLIKDGNPTKLARQEWLTEYGKSKEEGLTTLINFLIEASGCPNKINAKQLASGDAPEVMKKIITNDWLQVYSSLPFTNTAQNGESDYPVVSKKSEFKDFKENYIEFWKKLISKSTDKVLYDGIFIEALSNWMANFSSSSVRSIRHTATLTALSMLTSLIEIANRVQKNLGTSQRQLTQEEKKGTSEAKIKQHSDAVDKYQEKITLLEEMMDELFLGVFFRRYRDFVSEIRVECVSELGIWIEKYPQHFLEDDYLKYFGWTMNDKSPEVRLTSLESLERLLKNTSSLNSMSNFLERFKDRIVEMTIDKDINVSVTAIRLSILLANQDYLDQNDIESISNLVSNESAIIRSEAAKFVVNVVLDKEDSSSSKKSN